MSKEHTFASLGNQKTPLFYKEVVFPEGERHFGIDVSKKYFLDPWSDSKHSPAQYYYQRVFDLVYEDEPWCYEGTVYKIRIATDSGVPEVSEWGTVESYIKTHHGLWKEEAERRKQIVWAMGVPLVVSVIGLNETWYIPIMLLAGAIGFFAVGEWRQGRSKRKIKKLFRLTEKTRNGGDKASFADKTI
ncbi:hypothetical protein H6778_03620 [Candidatus Nomurabacteria bacterium]|uniref:Uncharacterized protein n=1 Tax=candidate division WWE3 bacterium TaxID=2053526 RepID=A0A955LVP7_UNCKA|nr:hypothetical protein [candidate division WWE3 bacterium]MCB9812718.1 hypothetical protein [Candidatus Nomurabacteria bacterium]